MTILMTGSVEVTPARTAIVSACYGAYDQPQPQPQQDIGVDWVMVTDGLADVPPPWRHRVDVIEGKPPRRAAKTAKACPHLYAPQADTWIWIDANIRVTSGGFASWCLAQLGEGLLAAMPTGWGMEGDYGAVASMKKYAGQPLAEQIAHYERQGISRGTPTWWTGLMVRSAACPDFGAAWLAEMDEWTLQDQLSLPAVLRRHGIGPVPLDVYVPEVTGRRAEQAAARMFELIWHDPDR